ncbi:hypothetical protein APHAL10511_005751 [Amanita phalloides]|nr:hypothetical protein APHAL10511_005751 [Amanita phalloides]
MPTDESDDHRRQRRALSPAFSNASLRALTSVFYDSAYKVKANWSASFESNDEAVIDVQKWMNRITLDSIGIAGFGHDFKALEGHQSPVIKVFESFNTLRNSSQRFFFLLGPIFPQISPSSGFTKRKGKLARYQGQVNPRSFSQRRNR